MFKLKIVHKGLILVCVPLIVGVILNLVLCYGFNLANRFAERGLMFEDATISFIRSTRCSALAQICAMTYLSSHEKFYKEQYLANKKNSYEADRHLRKILKREKNLVIPELAQSSHNLLQGLMGPGTSREMSTTSPFLHDLQTRADASAKSARQSMDSLQKHLLMSIFVVASVAIALAVFFCLNITNRLLLILGNTVSLSRGTPLRVPLQGEDEIAELDQLLYKSATEIRELERFKKEMIGVVSHELKSPLSSVASFLSSMSAGVYGELSAKAKEKVDRTYLNVKRLMGLVAELLFLDRLELDMKPEKIKAADLFSSAVDSVKELSEKTGIEIVVKNELSSEIFADRNRLVQVLVNLLSNAMKFSPADGKVFIDANEHDAYFECRVRDQGRGIPESYRKQIFEPFKQIDARDATTKKGTGLGLSISKSIVEQHSGEIGVDSEEGKGSTFWFKIPLDPAVVSSASKNPGLVANASDSTLKLYFDFKNSSGRKFNVLQRGLLIISIPLLFQTTFVGVLAYMIGELREQTKREEHSQQVLNTLNRMAEHLAAAVNYGMVYSYTKDPAVFQQWKAGKKDTLALVEQAKQICSRDPQALRDLEESRQAINKISDKVDLEAKSENTSQGVKKLLEMAGMGDALGGRNPIQLLLLMSQQMGTAPMAFRLGRDGQGGVFAGEAELQEADTGTPLRSGADLPPSPGPVSVTHADKSTKTRQQSKHDSGTGNSPPEPSKNSPQDMAGYAETARTGGTQETRRKAMHKALSSTGLDLDSPGAGKLEQLMEAMSGIEPGGMMGIGRTRRMASADPIASMTHMPDMSKIASLLSSFGGAGPMGAMGMLSHLQETLNKSMQVQMVRPLLEAQAAQENFMDREKFAGKRLRAQRAVMVRNLQITLGAGMLLNAGLSVFFAIYLMKNLRERLQHLMANTQRLVKRESMNPPKPGSDEIAFLDKVLFETGNHLVELENFKKELISIVSHELRTPLLSVSSALELFSVGAMGELSEKGKNRLNLAREESGRLIRLINDLLDIEKMDAGKFVLDKSQTSVADLIAQAVESVANLADQKQLTIETSSGSDNLSIFADKDRLCQVLINLLSNAIKYSPENGLIKVRVEEAEPGFLRFAVLDEGRGIPAELSQKIFDRFVQVEEADSTVKGGSGLGLAISRAIVEQHAGTIGVESVVGRGSEFWFKLPVGQETRPQEAASV